MLVGVIKKPTLEAAASLLRRLDPSPYGLLELRLDACRDLGATGVARLPLPLPAIFTLRPKEEGGDFAGSEAERLALLAKLMRLEPAYMDLEASLGPERVERLRSLSPRTKIILSRHDFERTPDSLQDTLAAMRKTAPDAVYKIAAKARGGLDALRMLLFCKEQSAAGLELVGISMGEDGESTRVLAPLVHAGLCYCPLEEASAPGQLDAATLMNTYNFPLLGRNTAVYGLIGDPVSQSAGHVFHNERNAAARCYAGRDAGRDAQHDARPDARHEAKPGARPDARHDARHEAKHAARCDAVYVKWRIPREDINAAMPLLHRLGVRGLSVTMPLKEAVMPFVTDADEAVTAVGAANTLQWTPSGWSAANTDGPGALDALQSGGSGGVPFNFEGATVVVLGAGGAARAVMREAAARGAKLVVYNRSADKALPANAALLPFSRLGELARAPYDLIVNALPFDLDFDFSQIPFRAGSRALDLSYGGKSLFLERAGAAGCRTSDGRDMFRTQALLQRRFWGLPT